MTSTRRCLTEIMSKEAVDGACHTEHCHATSSCRHYALRIVLEDVWRSMGELTSCSLSWDKWLIMSLITISDLSEWIEWTVTGGMSSTNLYYILYIKIMWHNSLQSFTKYITTISYQLWWTRRATVTLTFIKSFRPRFRLVSWFLVQIQ